MEALMSSSQSNLSHRLSLGHHRILCSTVKEGGKTLKKNQGDAQIARRNNRELWSCRITESV